MFVLAYKYAAAAGSYEKARKVLAEHALSHCYFIETPRSIVNLHLLYLSTQIRFKIRI